MKDGDSEYTCSASNAYRSRIFNLIQKPKYFHALTVPADLSGNYQFSRYAMASGQAAIPLMLELPRYSRHGVVVIRGQMLNSFQLAFDLKEDILRAFCYEDIPCVKGMILSREVWATVGPIIMRSQSPLIHQLKDALSIINKLSALTNEKSAKINVTI